MALYRNGAWVIEDEAEVEPVVEQVEEAAEVEQNKPETMEEPEPATAEEQTWKKRYGDLRKFVNDLQNEVKSLKEQLKSTTASPAEAAPVSKDEVSEWLKQNPEMVAIVKELVAAEIGTPVTDIDSRLRQVEERERAIRFEEAKKQVLAKHPDFPKIARTADFAAWVKEQPDWVRDSLYAEDDIDVKAAIRAIDWYKAEKMPKSARNEDPSKSIPRRSSPEVMPNPDKKVWKESEIIKLSGRDYEKYEDEIEAARRERRIVLDVSGAAR